MIITFKTPPVKTNNAISTIIPHLVEHIAWSPKNMTSNDFFSKMQNTICEVYATYSSYDFERKPRKRELKRLCLPLEKDVFAYEKKLFLQEIRENKYNYLSGLNSRISKKLYWIWYKWDEWKLPNFKEINIYHNKYYTKEKCVVSDDNDKIIYIGEDIKTQKNIWKDTIEIHSIKKWKDQIHCLCFSYTSSENYRLAFFIRKLLENYTTYTKRYKLWIYHYDTVDFFQTYWHWIVSYTWEINIPIDFFQAFKQYFYAHCLTTYDRYWKVIDIVSWITPFTDEEYKKRIKSVSFENIQKILLKKE